MFFPQVERALPELMPFVEGIVRAVQARQIDSVARMDDRVKAFFTPALMDKTEAILPGWKTMSAYADGQTLTHVMTVMAALLVCPEYQAATQRQQALMKWIVLFHDIAKQAIPGKRDQIHGFRSAALTGKALLRLGFPLRGGYQAAVDDWAAFTATAILPGQNGTDTIQDNAKLPMILEGIDRIFGPGSASTLIIKPVLLHMSINVVQEWPQAAPLTDTEIRRWVDLQVMPLLKIMMLVDNDAWSFFDAATKRGQRKETLSVFSRIEKG